MRKPWLALAIATAACSGTPTGGGEPQPTPVGTILAGSPNSPENGTYLIDIATGTATRVATGQDPLSVAFQGGYSAADRIVYGVSTLPPPDRIMAISMESGDTSVVIEMSDADSFIGAFHLSPDGRSLAIQTQYWPTGKVRLSTVDLATRTWTPIVDAVGGLDTIPLASIRWSPDGRTVYAVTDLFPDRSELIKIDLATQHFTIISPTTKVNGSLDVSPDGQLIAHADGDGRITLRNPEGHPVSGLPEIASRAIRPAFSPDGKFLSYQALASDGPRETILMRLSDGKRWPLKIEGDLNLWLSDWF